MTTFLIILGALVYLFIGGIFAGLMTNDYDRDMCGCILIVVIWPLIIGGILLGLVAMAPIKIGEKIKERNEKMKW